MLYLDDKMILYPSRGILSDAMIRSVSTEDSYSPINSEIIDIIDFWVNKKKNSVIAAFDFSKFDSYYKYNDISARVVKYASNNKDMNGTTITSDDWETLTPKALNTFIIYFQQVLWGIAYRDTELQRQAVNTVGYRTSQTNDGEFKVDITDEIISDEEDYAENVDYERMHIKSSKLVYYIKLINELSVQKGVNILQLLILKERYGGNVSMIMRDGVERIDMHGNVFAKYADSYSRSEPWRILWGWLRSKDDNDMWLRIINRFILLCEELDIIIAIQDWREYSVKNMGAVICSYFETNTDFINTIGRFDPIVAAAIDSSQVFTQKSNIQNMLYDWNESSLESNIPDLYRELLMLIQYDLFNVKELTNIGKRELDKISPSLRLLEDKIEETNALLTKLFSDFGFPIDRVNKLLNIDNSGFYYYMSRNTNTMVHLTIDPQIFKMQLITNSPDKLYVTENGIFIWSVIGKINSIRYCTIEEIIPMLGYGGIFPNGVCQDI